MVTFYICNINKHLINETMHIYSKINNLVNGCTIISTYSKNISRFPVFYMNKKYYNTVFSIENKISFLSVTLSGKFIFDNK